MARVPCPECASQVSDQAKACPKCGHPLGGAAVTSGPSTAAPSLLPTPKQRKGRVAGRPAVSLPAQTAVGDPANAVVGDSPAGYGVLLVALGVLFVVYRLAWTAFFLWYASFATSCASCCCCGFGVGRADELSGGFIGSWRSAGEIFDHSSGDTFMQVVSFGAWSPVTYASIGMIVIGMLLQAYRPKKS